MITINCDQNCKINTFKYINNKIIVYRRCMDTRKNNNSGNLTQQVIIFVINFQSFFNNYFY